MICRVYILSLPVDHPFTPSFVTFISQSKPHSQSKLPSLSVMPLDEAERVLTLQLALKCSDMGHTSADLAVHLRWVSVLEEEVRKSSI